jgi:hypothetical protein
VQTTVKLVANEWARVEIAGRLFIIEDTGAAASVEVRVVIVGGNDEDISAAVKGFKVRMTAGHFAAVLMRSTIAADVKIIVSDNDIDLNLIEGAAVNATLVNPLPVPVQNDRGTPGNLMFVSGVSVADAPATAATNNAAVACTAVAAVIAAADATCRELRIYNIGPDPVMIGPATGLAWAKRTIVIEAGDVWVETRGPNLAWSGICDTAKTASVTFQRVQA